MITGIAVAHLRDDWQFDDCGGSGQIVTASSASVTNLGRPVATVGAKTNGLHASGCPADPIPVAGVITTGDPRITINGKPIAVPGSSVVTGPTCGTNLGHVQ